MNAEPARTTLPARRGATKMLVAQAPEELEDRFVAAGAVRRRADRLPSESLVPGVNFRRDEGGWTFWFVPHDTLSSGFTPFTERVLVRSALEARGTRLSIRRYDLAWVALEFLFLIFGVLWAVFAFGGEVLAPLAWIWPATMAATGLLFAVQRRRATSDSRAALALVGEVLSPLALGSASNGGPFRAH